MKRAIGRLRLVQLSPLIVVALVAAVWLSVPSETRFDSISPLYMSITSPESQVLSFDRLQVSVMESILRHEQGLEAFEALPVTSGARAIEGLARGTSAELADIEPRVCDEDGVPRALSPEEQATAFADVTAFEEEHDASVAVLVVSTDPAPPVALFSVGDDSILTEQERAAIEGRGTVEELRRLAHKRKTGPVWVDLAALGSGISGEEVRDGRRIGWSTLMLDGHFWESYTITPDGTTSAWFPSGMWSSIADPGLRQSADALARSTDGAVLVVGPVDSGQHLVRPAPGMSTDGSAELWDLFGPTWQYEALWSPVVLDRASRATAGGADLAEWAMAGSANSPRVVLVALYEKHPYVPALWEKLGRSPLMLLRVGVGTYLSVILAILGLALVASCVASPLAFRAERLYREELEVERERVRVQREAELRVVSRLDELSARVEFVKEHASDATAASVTGVAEDIDSTVAELRSILGDVVGKGHTDE